MKKVVTIHQPNFFPWLGFFDKMAKADLFVLLDHVPFTKGGFQNRVQILDSSGPQWLTIPVVTTGKLGQDTREVELNSKEAWQRSHLGKLHASYRKAPGYKTLLPELEAIYASKSNRLLDITIPTIELVRTRLNISTPFVHASASGIMGSGSRLLHDLVRDSGGAVYLSGPSGRDYLETGVFAASGIDVAYHSFSPFEYPQSGSQFVPKLSALDYLMNDPALDLWNSYRESLRNAG